MFLKRFAPSDSENGSALVAVLGVFAIGIILSALIVASVVHGLGWSTFSRASVQSHAAADAGIVAARTGLYSVGNCTSQSTPGVYSSASSPKYRVTVERNNGAGWVAGCPTALTSQVRLTSRGTAEAPAVGGVSAGDSVTIEAVYQYLVPGVDPSGVAMYLYNGAIIEANSALDLSEGGNTGLIVKDGKFDCNKNNGVINGSVVIRGDLSFGGKCTVTGSAVVTGTATLGSGRINGDLTAGSVSPNPPGTHVGGVYTQSSTVPAIPDWVNLGYQPSDWRSSSGLPFQVQTIAPSCKLNSGTLGGTVPGFPLILNALGCSGGVGANNNTTVSLTSDVVIFSNTFDFSGVNSLSFVSSSTASHHLWFITPDNGVAGDKAPTCGPGQGDFTVKNSFLVKAPIAAMLYTPCAFNGFNGFTWVGQIYAGKYSAAKNNPSFAFVQVGAAGVDFDNSTTTQIITKPQPGGLVTQRDLSVG